MSLTADSGPFCGAQGCGAAAVAVVDHPTHGQLVACADHASGYEVVRDV